MLSLPPPLTLANLDDHMILVEGDTFEMGGEGHKYEKPIHKVELDDFYLCQYPVSQQLWKEVMGGNPEELFFVHAQRPLEMVSWNDIVNEFLPRLREKTGIKAYCLPTEAQWEYAARGGRYRNIDSSLPTYKKANFTYAGSNELKEVGWYNKNSYNETQPMALKRPNQLGLYGMSGNVLEWCQDWHDDDYYQRLKDKYGNEAAPNPRGSEEGYIKVVRGGSWSYNSSYARVSARFDHSSPYFRYDYLGFRLCRY